MKKNIIAIAAGAFILLVLLASNWFAPRPVPVQIHAHWIVITPIVVKYQGTPKK
jgi:hypothetical protein